MGQFILRNNVPKVATKDGVWCIVTFNTSNGKRIEYLRNDYYGITESDTILLSGLIKDQTIQKCHKLSRELNIPVFDNSVDKYITLK